MEWQPIETAPKSGTRILVFVPGFRRTKRHSFPRIDTAYWVSQGAPHWENRLTEYHPTHWMPLPEPPEVRA